MSFKLPELEDAKQTRSYVSDAHQADLKQDLVPQPSSDVNDPLNWSQSKKHLILLIISVTALLPDYGSATGAVAIISQAISWQMDVNTVNHATVGNLFMLGAGGLVVVALAAYFGRLPTLFHFTLLGFLTAVWCAAANTFNSFLAARILNGFFATVAQGGGLMFIQDIFYFHEHARKINIWAFFIVLSPYLGPLISAFIISTQRWQWAFGVFATMSGLCLLAIILFVDETFYDRKIPTDRQPPRGSRWTRLLGIQQFRTRRQRNTFLQAVMRPLMTISKLPVLISSIYYLFTFAWVVGINNTLAILVTPLYGFGIKQIGFFYFTPVIAAILGEITGHWLHDAAARVYARRHGGKFEPESRLLVIWLSTPCMVAGLTLIGFSIESGYHYMLTALAWGLYVFGIMITTVGLTAYNLDSYPEASGEVAAWINFARTTGGFIVTYFQIKWADAIGAKKSFGTQAGIVAAMFLLIITLQFRGKALRQWSGNLGFKTS